MSQYEFTREQNKIISNVALRCIVNAIAMSLLGVVNLIGAITTWGNVATFLSIVGLLYGVLFTVVGVAFFRPSDNFRRVTTTQGNDIAEIMTGLKELRTGFKVTSILIIVILVLDVATIIFYTQ